ncbi:hypothetical protein MRX96_000790 [Rhipicephalus microplus]
MKKLHHSASQWSSDLSSVPQVTSDVIENHFGQIQLIPKALAEITFKKHFINKTVHDKLNHKLEPNVMRIGPQWLKRIREQMAAHAPEVIWNFYTTGKPALLRNKSPMSDREDLHSPKSLQFIDEYFRKLVPLTAAEREEVHLKTLGHSHNPSWQAERTDRLTASKFRRALHCRKPEGLVKEILYPRKEVLRQGDPRLYGVQNEVKAVDAYVHLMKLYEKKIQVVQTGVHVHIQHCFIAASPDHLVIEGSETGLLEVRCPALKAGVRIINACNDRAFCSEIIDGEVTLKRDHAYYYQIKAQLGVTPKPWTNHSEHKHSVSLERKYFDLAVWKDILKRLIYVYKVAVIPELQTRRIRRLGFLYTTGAGYV